MLKAIRTLPFKKRDILQPDLGRGKSVKVFIIGEVVKFRAKGIELCERTSIAISHIKYYIPVNHFYGISDTGTAHRYKSNKKYL